MRCRYVALDIETSGLDETRCQVLELAAVVETDWATPVEQLPSFHWLIDRDTITGQPGALAIHARIFAELALIPRKRTTPCAAEPEVMMEFRRFLNKNFVNERHVTVAGKNVASFDLRFLNRIVGFPADKIRHRVIDPGMLYFDPRTDDVVPDTATCLKRAGLVNDRPHHPTHDCRAVIELIRAHYSRHRDAVPEGEPA